MSQELTLGIDLGTTSVKVVVYSRAKGEIVAKQSKDTQANVPSDLGIDGNKQDVPKILSAVHSCISRLPKDLLRQVTTIGVCGQMHGVALWKGQRPSADEKAFKLEIPKTEVSHLYTWQDSRCDAEFLNSLPPSRSHLPVHSGYGCATIFWFARNKPEKLSKYNRCGTVQDLMVNLLCGSEDVAMSSQNAASFGYFLTEEGKFEMETMSTSNFPIDLLPKRILRPGEIAGHLMHTWFGIPEGVPVGVALGDLQCSVFALLKGPDEAVMNISTSAQLTYVQPTFKPGDAEDSATVEYFPYFKDEYLAVSASLNGGNSLASFVKMIQQWTMELGFSVPQAKVWEKLISLGQEDSAISSMRIEPLLLGERHDPLKTASVTDISLDTLHLGTVFRALCSGVIQNLHGMMSQELLKKKGIKKIVGNGSGLVRNPVLQKEVQHWYKLPLELGHSGDAALGAALAGVAHQ
ncbi:sedoheptulokinase isoform X2 [Fopius arisanus]|uniref:Sedoheptulokinase n=1 Tax=Fopius arisanus TaxID=64838 RepID=A0A9R1U430_9HYME|nr:PREDICTED: sedoheptulokinase-like isoform X2 [Fopius arisanus]XP_011306344.1 PREDICTED: sedoheptulokinase-like isoform X2 [Fopius arisanus]XP_011306345.1 PREDICTED: sedoheptulokinase-like isoform X2 [Fopius arisanus]XP_011306346.1 PREDICTED: sedoheptulokinase-like isoform X2 [Fopius arisanus]